MARIFINENHKKGHINPEIQGQFSEHLGRGIYEGLYVRSDSGIENVNGMRTDVVDALKEMKVPLLRWPGGCFADEYHWKDGIGLKQSRKKMINTHWGGVLEDNSFGTHEFFELARQLGCKTYINGNLGSGTVQEMSEWIEYMTFDGVSPMTELRKANGREKPWRVDYFGIGNENWGCGGNMTPEYYANLYRRYQTYCRQYHSERPFLKVCGGPNMADTNWTKKVLETCFAEPAGAASHGFMDLLSIHYYVHPGEWENKGSATEFTEDMYYQTMERTLYTEDLLKIHGDILDTFDPEKKIGFSFDEWGGWYEVEPGTNPGFLYQQNTMRDALLAGVTLNIFNQHCDRVKLACLAQMVNVIQSVILTEGEKMILTPTYHVFHMYKDHQDGELLDSVLLENGEAGNEEHPIPALSESVSMKDGVITVTIANMDADKSYPVTLEFADRIPEKMEGRVVTEEMHAHNTFENPDTVTERALSGIAPAERGCTFTIPACSVVKLSIR